MDIGEVRPFRYTYSDDKRQFSKPLEESAELFAAWKRWARYRCSSRYGPSARRALEDALADTLQAVVNCADAIGIEDMSPYMRRCEVKNKRKGRY